MNIRVGQRVKFETITVIGHEGEEVVVRDITLTATGKVQNIIDDNKMLFVDADKDVLPGIREVWLPIEEMDPSLYPAELFGAASGATVIEDDTTISVGGHQMYMPGNLIPIKDEIAICKFLADEGVIESYIIPMYTVADWRLRGERGEFFINLCSSMTIGADPLSVHEVYFLVMQEKDEKEYFIMIPKSQESIRGYAEEARENPKSNIIISFIMSAFRSNEWVVM
jgi:hypothetical protein